MKREDLNKEIAQLIVKGYEEVENIREQRMNQNTLNAVENQKERQLDELKNRVGGIAEDIDSHIKAIKSSYEGIELILKNKSRHLINKVEFELRMQDNAREYLSKVKKFKEKGGGNFYDIVLDARTGYEKESDKFEKLISDAQTNGLDVHIVDVKNIEGVDLNKKYMIVMNSSDYEKFMSDFYEKEIMASLREYFVPVRYDEGYSHEEILNSIQKEKENNKKHIDYCPEDEFRSKFGLGLIEIYGGGSDINKNLRDAVEKHFENIVAIHTNEMEIQSGIKRSCLKYNKLDNDEYELSDRNVNAYSESLRMLEKNDITQFLQDKGIPITKRNAKFINR